MTARELAMNKDTLAAPINPARRDFLKTTAAGAAAAAASSFVDWQARARRLRPSLTSPTTPTTSSPPW